MRNNQELSFLDSPYGALDQTVSGFEGDSFFITRTEGERSDPDSRNLGWANIFWIAAASSWLVGPWGTVRE